MAIIKYFPFLNFFRVCHKVYNTEEPEAALKSAECSFTHYIDTANNSSSVLLAGCSFHDLSRGL